MSIRADRSEEAARDATVSGSGSAANAAEAHGVNAHDDPVLCKEAEKELAGRVVLTSHGRLMSINLPDHIFYVHAVPIRGRKKKLTKT